VILYYIYNFRDGEDSECGLLGCEIVY